MIASEHVATARRMSDLSDRLLADNDKMLAAEALWGAAIHAVNAVAMQRNLSHGNYRRKLAAVRLLSGYPDGRTDLTEGFLMARTRLHVYFDKAHLTDQQLLASMDAVRDFVTRMLAMDGQKDLASKLGIDYSWAAI